MLSQALPVCIRVDNRRPPIRPPAAAAAAAAAAGVRVAKFRQAQIYYCHRGCAHLTPIGLRSVVAAADVVQPCEPRSRVAGKQAEGGLRPGCAGLHGEHVHQVKDVCRSTSRRGGVAQEK